MVGYIFAVVPATCSCMQVKTGGRREECQRESTKIPQTQSASSRTAGMACDAGCQIDVRNLLISQPAEPISQPVQGCCEDLLNRGSRKKLARLFQVRSPQGGTWYVINRVLEDGEFFKQAPDPVRARGARSGKGGLFQFLRVTASGARQGLARSHRVSSFVFGRLSGARVSVGGQSRRLGAPMQDSGQVC